MRSAKMAVALAVLGGVLWPATAMAQPAGTVLTDQEWGPNDLVVTDAEREAASAAAAGGVAGIIVPSLAYGYFRTLSEAAGEALGGLGLTVETCEARSASGLDAADCFTDLVERGARVIVVTTIPSERVEAAASAIAEGTVVVQVNIANLSEAGAPRVAVEDTTPSLAALAADTAAGLWGEAPVSAIILGDPDLPGFEFSATQVQEAIAELAPQVTVTGHLPGRLPWWAQDSLKDALAEDAPPGLVIGLIEFGIVSASTAYPSIAFVSQGCSPAAATAVAAGGNYKGCARTAYPEESGRLAAAVATKLLAGGEAPGAVLIPVTTMIQDPMLDLEDVTTATPPHADDPRLAACADRVAMLPADLDGEALSYEFVDGYQAVESGELPVEVLIRLHLASGSGLSEAGVCLIRFAYGSGTPGRGTLWALDGEFICRKESSSADCQVDRYVSAFTGLAVPGAKAKASRPKIGGRRVEALKLPAADIFAVRVGPDLPVRQVFVARIADTFATFGGREAAEAVLPALPGAD